MSRICRRDSNDSKAGRAVADVRSDTAIAEPASQINAHAHDDSYWYQRPLKEAADASAAACAQRRTLRLWSCLKSVWCCAVRFFKHQGESTVRSRTSRHWEILFFSLVVVAGAFFLELHNGVHVTLRGIPSASLPPLCMSHELLGVRCPGCGLTRSIIHLAEFDLRASLDMHRLGWLMGVVVLLQFPYRIAGLMCKNRQPLPPKATKAFGNGLIALLIVNWCLQSAGY